jgi:4-hydroxybenzoate polyprenyltransferase
MTPIRDWVGVLRPKQWLKNVFVLAPAVFSEHITNPATVRAAGLAFFVFCLLSSAMYVLNDVIDRPADATHPRKKRRAIAAGRVGVRTALVAAAALTGLSFGVSALTLPPKVMAFQAAYVTNTLLYALWLKQKVILDVLLIAVGFVIRLEAGCAAVAVEPSAWLVVCGFSLALVLGFGKRRAEVALPGVSEGYRPTLISYDAAKLNTLLGACTAVCLLAYMLYTVAPETVARHGTNHLVYTVPIVAYGLFRYLFKSIEGSADGPTDILARDPVFAFTGLAWGAAVLAALTWK